MKNTAPTPTRSLHIADFTRAFPGVWKGRLTGSPSPSPMALSGSTPKAEAMASLPKAGLPPTLFPLTLEQVDGRHHLAIPLAGHEDLYGFGLTFKGLVHTGKRFDLSPDHWHGRDDGHTHAPLPFYMSSAGYGVFVDTSRPVQVWAGRTHRAENPPPLQDRTEDGWNAVLPGSTVDFLFDGVACDVYLLEGPTMADVVRRYNLLCGGGAMPPKWGLGFWHRMHLKDGEKECAEVTDGYRKRGLPLAVLGLEPGWHSRCYPTSHEWRPSLFPDPAGFVARMKRMGIELNLWQNLFIPHDTALGKSLAPHAASHTGSWGGLVPDLTLSEARTALADHLSKHLLDLGISGFKLDEVEDPSWLFPRFATMPSGHTADEVHNLLGLMVQRLTAEAYRVKGDRTWGLARGTHLGGASLPFTLYNDAYEHRDFITALCSSSFGGLLWTPEVRDAKTAEDWLRRIQAVCFSPIAMINAWASTLMPWSFPEVEAGVSEAMKLRHRLLPYFYSAFARYHREGIPPFRAMHLEPGFIPPKAPTTVAETHGTTNPYARPKTPEVKDQWMAGDHLLVAPLFAGETERTVLLPPGVWYDFYTGKACGEGSVKVTSNLGPIPLFVRDGGIIPLLADGVGGWEGPSTPLEVRLYGVAPGRFDIFDDDGRSFDFETKGFKEIRLTRNGTEAKAELVADPDGKGTVPEIKWKWM